VYDAAGGAAVVQFERCLRALVGSPSDDPRHPRLAVGSQVELMESPWVFDRATDTPGGVGERLVTGQRHFVFSFPHEVFECIASHYLVIGVFPEREAFETAARIAFEPAA
jgi:hypothetical protein